MLQMYLICYSACLCVCCAQEQERGMERLQSENKLINIRLSSLSEILSIQEAEVAKVRVVKGCITRTHAHTRTHTHTAGRRMCKW